MKDIICLRERDGIDKACDPLCFGCLHLHQPQSPTEIGQQGEWSEERIHLIIDKLFDRGYDVNKWVELRAAIVTQFYYEVVLPLENSQPTPPQEGQDELWDEFAELFDEFNFNDDWTMEDFKKRLSSLFTLIKK